MIKLLIVSFITELICLTVYVLAARTCETDLLHQLSTKSFEPAGGHWVGGRIKTEGSAVSEGEMGRFVQETM